MPRDRRTSARLSSWAPDRPKTRGGAPAPLAQVLADTQKSAAGRAGSALSPDEWRGLVGPKIAGRTRVGRLNGRSLTVFAASSAWCNELSLLKADIVARLQSAGHDVDDLRVRVAPFAEPEKRRTSTGVSERPGTLPPELRARLEQIDDPELRAAVAEAAALSLAAQARMKK